MYEKMKKQNAVLAQSEFEKNSIKTSNYPVKLEVSLNSRCNVECVFCRHIDEKSNKQISFEKIFGLEKIYPYISRVSLTGEEVILHPDIWDILTVLKQFQIYVSLSTNGKALKPDKMIWLIENNIDRIDCSFHGASSYIFNSIVQGASFENIIRQFQFLKEYKQELAAADGIIRSPKVAFHYVIMRRNVEELPRFIELAANLGADEVYTKYLVITKKLRHLSNESLIFYPELAEKVMEHCIEKAKEIPISFFPPSGYFLRGAENKHYLCSKPWTEAHIDVNGEVYPCCEKKLQPSLGNIYESSFEDIWNGLKYQELREKVNSSDPADGCRNCSYRNPAGINQISKHLVYLEETAGSGKAKKSGENMKGGEYVFIRPNLYSKEEKLFEAIMGFLELWDTGKHTISQEMYELMSQSEFEALHEKLSAAREIEGFSKEMLMVLLLRFLNKSGHICVADRLYKCLFDDIPQSVSNIPTYIITQAKLEFFYSGIMSGFYSKAVYKYETDIKYLLSDGEKSKIAEFIRLHQWRMLLKFLAKNLDNTLSAILCQLEENNEIYVKERCC